jgi:peptide/nickel transport system ATP-binding protein
MIAIAVALRPALLIADEPTTALDVTVQAQLLRLMLRLCHESGTALLLVTHDLGVVAQVADRVAVMYAGRVVEQAPVTSLFDRPQHPYTEGLLAALPVPGQRRERLADIPGSVPMLDQPFSACRFEARCARRIEGSHSPCRDREPPWVANGHRAGAACWLRTEISDSP